MSRSPQAVVRATTDGVRSAGTASVSLLRDGGYASIGAADKAVSYARLLGERAGAVRGKLSVPRPRTVLSTPRTVATSLRELGDTVEHRFEALAGHGRDVVASLQGNRATEAAGERVRVARTQVKAAGTSVQRAGEAAVDAAEAAADEIGDPDDTDYASMTVEQLRALARERDIDGRSDMNKAELVEALTAT